MEKTKSQLGQFYTTNSHYILQGLEIPTGARLIEPFVGNGDLLRWANKEMEVYDIDPQIPAETRDTLLDPPDYHGKFVVTNPPYLAKNKNKDKRIYEKYQVDDLYKASIKSIVQGNAAGGILIVPINFISGRDFQIREMFFHKYDIRRMNIFEEQVFEDTSNTVCAFEFHKIAMPSDRDVVSIDCQIYPSGAEMKLNLFRSSEYTLAKESFPNIKSKYNIRRLLKGESPTTNLFLRAVDTGTTSGRISLSVNEEHFYGKNTDRAFATIQSDCPIPDEHELCKKFNKSLESYRDKYHSLFLTNFRNSTSSYARKRISFRQAYSLIEQILSQDHELGT